MYESTALLVPAVLDKVLSQRMSFDHIKPVPGSIPLCCDAQKPILTHEIEAVGQMH